MAVVHIPALLLSVTGGERELVVNGTTVQELIDQLEIRHPGLKRRLVEGDRLRAGLSVFVDGAARREGLNSEVSPQSEVHFIPAIAGGTITLIADGKR
jgi:molybdopterin synthase sulfur carrier subunit